MRAANVFHLGIKELRSLQRDPIMIFLIIYAFSLAIYISATSIKETMVRAPIAIVDEDRSQLSARIIDAFYPPYFMRPHLINFKEMDVRMNGGLDTFALVIPFDFQKDVLAKKQPKIQLNIDATRMSQSFIGNSYIQSIIGGEVNEFLKERKTFSIPPVDLVLRVRFNPELKESWFAGIMELINSITSLAIILTGAALIREREHGTVEHLLVMPVTPLEIMLSKVWSMGLVVFVAATLALMLVVQKLLSIPIEGSIFLFLAGASLHLFATTSLGIFLATVARSMPQFGLLLMLLLLPMELLSGSVTPRESMPQFIQNMMLAVPNTHFVALSQAILYRGAGFSVVWPQFLALAIIGSFLFSLSLARFRKTLTIG